mmetsp:Transcript_48762/g.113856  ORF Transcript_48762/g.113856 Transcript_48762/m.113856 type:complete len:274 (+) Transcript_48762:244-1065(+)
MAALRSPAGTEQDFNVEIAHLFQLLLLLGGQVRIFLLPLRPSLLHLAHRRPPWHAHIRHVQHPTRQWRRWRQVQQLLQEGMHAKPPSTDLLVSLDGAGRKITIPPSGDAVHVVPSRREPTRTEALVGQLAPILKQMVLLGHRLGWPPHGRPRQARHIMAPDGLAIVFLPTSGMELHGKLLPGYGEIFDRSYFDGGAIICIGCDADPAKPPARWGGYYDHVAHLYIIRVRQTLGLRAKLLQVLQGGYVRRGEELRRHRPRSSRLGRRISYHGSS